MLDTVRQFPGEPTEERVCVGNRAAHRRRIRAVGYVQLGNNELAGQDEACIPIPTFTL